MVSAGAFGVAPVAAASAITLQGEERKNLASVLADDPLRAVQSLPGVTSNNDFDSEFSLRGAPFDRIGLYLDGVLLHSPFHTTDGQSDDGSLTIFNGDMTDDMTLVRGRMAGPLFRPHGRHSGGRHPRRQSPGNSGAADRPALRTRAGCLKDRWARSSRGSWIVSFRKSYLDYILNRIDFGDQPPLAFGFTDGEARLTYDLTSKHTISLSDVEGASGVDRTRFQSELGVNTVMTSGFRFSLLNLGSRYAPNQRVLITNHLAWSRERGDVENRDNALLSRQAYGEWTWHGDVSVSWLSQKPSDKPGRTRWTSAACSGNSGRTVPRSSSYSRRCRCRRRMSSAAPDTGSAGTCSNPTGSLSDRIHLTAGVRQDEFSESPVQVTSPYASASFLPLKKTRVQLDWGQYAQFPELNQIFSFVHARSAACRRRATHYEAVVEQTLDERTRVRVEFYDRQDRDLLARPALDPRVVFVGGSSLPTIINALPNAPWLNSAARLFARRADLSAAADRQRIHRMDLLRLRAHGDQRWHFRRELSRPISTSATPSTPTSAAACVPPST